jgi:hypothetical protein
MTRARVIFHDYGRVRRLDRLYDFDGKRGFGKADRRAGFFRQHNRAGPRIDEFPAPRSYRSLET